MNSAARLVKRILIVEDDLEMAKMLSEIFLSAGYKTHATHDVMTGVKEAYDFRPDLIILDLMLPGGGGASFLNHLERSTHTQRIPIVVLTGMHDEETKKKILALGVKAYFEKPYSVENLLSEVKRITG